MVATTSRNPLSMEAWEIITRGGPEVNDDMRPHFKAGHVVACSAVANGWTETDLRNTLMDNPNGLWRQISTRRRRKQAFRTIDRMLSKIWKCAVDNIGRGFNPEREKDILVTAKQWSLAIANPAFSLSNSEADVLDFVIHEVARRKFRKVTLPGRDVAEHTGLSHKGAVDALKSLRDKGILICHSRGTWVGLGNKGRAAIYSLAEPAEFASLLGTLTLHHENTSEQQLSDSEATGGTHITPLLGEVCIEKSPYHPTGFGEGGIPRGRHLGPMRVRGGGR